MRTCLLAATVALLALIAPAGARQQSAAFRGNQGATFTIAMDRLRPLEGVWSGAGFVRPRPDGERTRYLSTWWIERSHDGRYLRIEIAMSNNTDRRDWVGYLTYHLHADLFTSLWRQIGGSYEFRERGGFDPEGRTLTLVSRQPLGPGGALVEVRSVFTAEAPNRLSVVDQAWDPVEQEWYESFSFTMLEDIAP